MSVFGVILVRIHFTLGLNTEKYGVWWSELTWTRKFSFFYIKLPKGREKTHSELFSDIWKVRDVSKKETFNNIKIAFTKNWKPQKIKYLRHNLRIVLFQEKGMFDSRDFCHTRKGSDIWIRPY